jgi:hypothetical protein
LRRVDAQEHDGTVLDRRQLLSIVPNSVKAVAANSTATRSTINGASRQMCRQRR